MELQAHFLHHMNNLSKTDFFVLFEALFGKLEFVDKIQNPRLGCFRSFVLKFVTPNLCYD